MITNDARCTREIKSRIANAKAALNNKKTLFTNKMDSNLRKKLIKCYIWSRALQGAETWVFWEANMKNLQNLEMRWWRGMEKIITQSHGGEECPAYNKNMEKCGNWIGHILRWNCLLKYVTEGNTQARIQATGRRGRRCKLLLDDHEEKTGYWKLKQEALYRKLRRTHFARGYGRVVRQTRE